MKCIIIINIIYLYYTVTSNVVRFKIKVVFVIEIFFIVFFYSVEVNFYNCKFFVFFFKR